MKNRFNDMRKAGCIIVIIAFLSALFLITGCTLGSNASDKYHIGTQGLVIEFAKTNPKETYENDEFSTAIFVKNLGASSITDNNPAVLKVSYDDYRLLALNDGPESGASRTIVLHGRDIGYPVGENNYYTYDFRAKPLTRLRESTTTTISYNLCYPYSTEFTTFICIDTKSVTNDNTASACTAETYSGGSGQGGPIVVTKIEPELQSRNGYILPTFKIYISNAGTGYVTNSTSCQYTDINDNTQMNRVRVYAVLSGQKLKCGNSDNNIRLSDSETYVRCQLEDNSASKYARTSRNYLTPLTVTLNYTYTDIEKQDLNVKSNSDADLPMTQGICASSYQVEYQGKCMTKCDYCSGDPNNDICKTNIMTAGFDFSGFSCSCSSTQCDDKAQKHGDCITGYCPGNLYCCSENMNTCDAYQILYNGKCIDKCYYCSTINPLDTDYCPKDFQFTGFSCMNISETRCTQYASSKACIKGFCGGQNINSYCANLQKIPVEPLPVKDVGSVIANK